MNVSDVRWGSYKEWEGPWTLGEARYVLPANATDEERIMAVITATEGGCYDSINMYDSCLFTAGIVQWCNRYPQSSVDDLLGVIYENERDAMEPLLCLAASRGYTFRREASKYWFYHGNDRVDSVYAQQGLYFGNSSGRKGKWRDEDRTWARNWCAAAAEVLSNPRSKQLQVRFTIPRMVHYFCYGYGGETLRSAPRTPYGWAWRALYLSFAANNPKRASDAVQTAVRQSYGVYEPWTAAWVTCMALHLTFDAGVSIYPGRYDKIRPVIERSWGVDLPDLSADVAAWSREHQLDHRWLDPIYVQRSLISLGYDLGPHGADGVVGKKTRAALLAFEKEAGLPAEYQDGMPDNHTMAALRSALEAHGLDP